MLKMKSIKKIKVRVEISIQHVLTLRPLEGLTETTSGHFGGANNDMQDDGGQQYMLKTADCDGIKQREGGVGNAFHDGEQQQRQSRQCSSNMATDLEMTVVAANGPITNQVNLGSSRVAL
jgi:hypothetical protein